MFRRLCDILCHKGHVHTDGVNIRGWFGFFVTLLVGLVVVILVGVAMDDAGRDSAERLWLMGLYFFYMCLCCSFFPAPTAWIVLLMASPRFGLVGGEVSAAGSLGEEGSARALTAVVTIAIVAAVGALGTALANLNEYHIFTFLLRFGKVHKLRQTRMYEVASRYFAINPFWLMTVVSFLPIPVDVVRWLAITHRYRRDHYAWASFLGRFGRYALLAATAFYLDIGWLGIIVIQFALLSLVAFRYVPRLFSRSGSADVVDSAP